MTRLSFEENTLGWDKDGNYNESRRITGGKSSCQEQKAMFSRPLYAHPEWSRQGGTRENKREQERTRGNKGGTRVEQGENQPLPTNPSNAS
jgi:hypothetical protein